MAVQALVRRPAAPPGHNRNNHKETDRRPLVCRWERDQNGMLVCRWGRENAEPAAVLSLAQHPKRAARDGLR